MRLCLLNLSQTCFLNLTLFRPLRLLTLLLLLWSGQLMELSLDPGPLLPEGLLLSLLLSLLQMLLMQPLLVDSSDIVIKGLHFAAGPQVWLSTVKQKILLPSTRDMAAGDVLFGQKPILDLLFCRAVFKPVRIGERRSLQLHESG